MTQITIQGGKAVLVDGKIGSGAACCCEGVCCSTCRFCRGCQYTSEDGVTWQLAAEFSASTVEDIQVEECDDCPTCPPDGGPLAGIPMEQFIPGYPATFYMCCGQDPPCVLIIDGLTSEPVVRWAGSCGDSTTCRSVSEAKCSELGGEWHPGQTCDANPCGCPDVEGCNLVVVLDYPGAPQEYSNEPIGELGGDCLLSGEIADIPIESGGDITWNLTVGTDGNGNPVPQNITIVRTVDSPDNDQSCDDGITDCVPVLFTIDCNPLP